MPVRGTLETLDVLKNTAKSSDSVVHCAFVHDFANFAASCQIDQAAISAIGDALAGSQKPLVISSGILAASAKPGQAATEDDLVNSQGHAALRGAAETLTLALSARGVRASVVRLPPTVHGEGDVTDSCPRW